MKHTLIRFFAALGPCLAACSGPNTIHQTDLAADTLFVGEHIVTMDPQHAGANAVAIAGESIVWVGQAEAWRGTAANVVQLGNRALLPGLIDAHGHFAFMARTVNLANVASPPVGAVTTIPHLQKTLADYMDSRATQPGEWVVGMGYDDSLLEERRHPTRDDLDQVSTTHPIVLIHVSGHLATANSMALSLAGIHAGSKDPAGGIIRRRPNSSEPNGVLEETALTPLRPYYMGRGGLTQGEIDQALHTYASHGITTVQDGAASWEIYQLLQNVELNLDVVVYPVAMTPDFAVPADIPLGEYAGRLKFGGIKLVLDGSPQGKTAYLSKPYHVVPAGLQADYRGYPTIPQAAVNERVEYFITHRVPMLVHCNGDAAAQMLLDALSRQVDPGDHRTVMIHAQILREDQLDAIQALGVVPSFFSAHTFYWGDWHRDSVLGEERGRRISATRSAVRRNIPFTVHNDAPIVPPDMVRLLWATTNRLTRSGVELGPEQAVDIKQALKAMTVDAAYQYFEEDHKGTITPGKQADLVILSANPLLMDKADLLDLDVLQTISRGKTVYTRNTGE